MAGNEQSGNKMESNQVKVPEGVSVEAPERRRGEFRIPGIPNAHIDPNLPKIVYPHYTNNDRTLLSCVLVRPDGQAMTEQNIPKDNNHPLYRDIRSQFSEEEIEMNTQREVTNQRQIQQAMQDAETEQKRLQTREDLWAQKTTFLDMDLVRNTKYKSLKRKLRSATSPIEAQAYGIAIILKETEDAEQAQ